MRFSPDDICRALARSPKAAVTRLAREVLKMSDALMRSPPYFDLAHRLGQQAARMKALNTSITAVAPRTADPERGPEPHPRLPGLHGRQERCSLFDPKI